MLDLPPYLQKSGPSSQKNIPPISHVKLIVPRNHTQAMSPSPTPACHSLLQVLDKHGDIFGRERIAELLGMDLASLEITAHNERKPDPPPGLLTW